MLPLSTTIIAIILLLGNCKDIIRTEIPVAFLVLTNSWNLLQMTLIKASKVIFERYVFAMLWVTKL
jgi:hypothetical protein